MTMHTRWPGILAAGLSGLGLMAECRGQSLFTRPPAPASAENEQQRDPAGPLAGVSLLAVQAPKPKTYAVHDQITIVIDENSKQTSDQKLDTKKDYSIKAALDKFPSLEKLLELQVENGDTTSQADLGVSGNNKFKGEGKYERTDRFVAKVTAKIIDVKPNGVLVLEARKTIVSNEETQTYIMSGECRREDVTTSNTVLSSQLANLTLIAKNEGQVKDSSTKGFIPRLLEAVFGF